ncbi:MAG TPA: response regulator, partial [Candidatus Deferrimicrobiaceae bacterium]
KILLVDDEVDYLTLLKLKLVSEGFDVDSADNAEDALACIERSKPDMVLSDVIMPGTDGLGMLRRLREKSEYADLPVVFLSGRDDNNVKIQALHLGAEDYMLKPVDFTLLAAKIRNVIRRDEKRKKGAAHGPSTGVVGDLKNLGIPEIVQTLHLGLKTACVTVNHPKGGEGRIYFENGRIRHCTVGEETGEDAFYRMLRWQEGPFVIAHGQTTTVRTIEMDEMQLMMEGMRRLDEEGKVPGTAS